MYKDQSLQHITDITVCISLYVKCPILSKIGIFLGILVKMQTWYFKKIRPAGDTLFHAER